MSDTDNPIEAVLANYRKFLEIVKVRVNTAVADGKFVPATTLGGELAAEFGYTDQQAYHFINAYVDMRPELYKKKGPNGGIGLKAGEEITDK